MTNEEYVTRLRSIIWSACGGVGIAGLLVNCLIMFTSFYVVINSLKAEISKSKCKCEGLIQKVQANGNQVTIQPDPNSFGALTREVLIREGKLNADVQ